MKVLGIIVAVLVVIVVCVIGFAYTLPGEFTSEGAALIACPPESLYVRFATPRTWARWSAWNARRDPTLAYTYAGPDSGVGAIMKWSSKAMGSGQLEIVEATPRLVHYELGFAGSASKVEGRVRLEPKAGGTYVTWHDAGSFGANPLMRFFFPAMKKMMARAYEESFAALRSEVHEVGSAPAKP